MPNNLYKGQKLNSPVAIKTAPTTEASIPIVVANPPSCVKAIAKTMTPRTIRIILSVEPTFVSNAIVVCSFKVISL